MNKKMISHGLTITAILIAVFIAAALANRGTYSQRTETSAVINLAKVDFENRTAGKGLRMIADNEIPMASEPFESGVNVSLWLIVVSTAAVMTGIVICVECSDKKSERF